MPSALNFLLKNKALEYPQFRNFLTMRFFISLALDMQVTIIYYWVYKLTNDVALVGVLGLCEAIPAIGCGLFSGHFVDQREKKGLIVWCTVGYLLLALAFTIISLHSFERIFTTNSIVHFIYLAVFLGGVLRSFIGPSIFSIFALLLPRKEYANATTWSSTAWQIGATVGPMLGGLMLALVDIPVSLMTTFAFEVVALIAVIRIPKQAVLKREKEPIIKSVKGGLKFVFKTQVILAALSLDMFAVLFGGATALLPAYAKDILHVGKMGYGLLRAAPGIGAIVTLFILSFLPLKTNPGIKLLLCIIGFGIATIIFGVSTVFLLSFGMLVIAGMFDAVSVIIRGTILQLYTPDTVRGRVSAVNTMFVSSSNELGAVESGYTAKWMGTVHSVVFGGCMTLVVVGVTYFAAPLLRKLSITVNDEEKTKSSEI